MNKHARFFYIDSSLAYQLILDTNLSEEIHIRALVEGEYQNEIILNIRESGSEIFISPSFTPEYQFKNDKLSAHKVISIALDISLPENLSVHLKGAYTNLNAKGAFKVLHIDLKDGRCYLDHTSGEIHANTDSGEIIVESNTGYVEASSNYGLVETHQLPLGGAAYYLKSISGNIRVIRRE